MLGMISDEEILDAVDHERKMHGACTYRGMARTIGCSPTAVRYRIQKLMTQGLVESLGTGGIRRTRPAHPPQREVLLRVRWDPSAPEPLDVQVVKPTT